jgi:penicillin-binding protein-related factor A (putative recombinase)
MARKREQDLRDAAKNAREAKILKKRQQRELEKQGNSSAISYFILYQPNNNIYFLKSLALYQFRL